MEQHSSLVEQVNSAQSLHRDADDVERNILYRQLASLEPVVSLANQLKSKEKVCEDFGQSWCSWHVPLLWQEETELELLIQQSEGELGELALEELCVCREEIERLKASLVDAIIPQDEADQHSAVLELRPGKIYF